MSYVAGERLAVLLASGDGEFHAVLIARTRTLRQAFAGTQIIYQVIKKRFSEGFRVSTWASATAATRRISASMKRRCETTQKYSMAGFRWGSCTPRQAVKNFLRNYVRMSGRGARSAARSGGLSVGAISGGWASLPATRASRNRQRFVMKISIIVANHGSCWRRECSTPTISDLLDPFSAAGLFCIVATFGQQVSSIIGWV